MNHEEQRGARYLAQRSLELIERETAKVEPHEDAAPHLPHYQCPTLGCGGYGVPLCAKLVEIVHLKT